LVVAAGNIDDFATTGLRNRPSSSKYDRFLLTEHFTIWSYLAMSNNRAPVFKILSLMMVLAAATFLNGCVYHDYNSPHIEGVLTRQGQPLVNVNVSLASYDQIVQTTTTDSKGYFSLAPKGEWNVFIPIGPQDRFNQWQVIIEQGSEKITGYKDGHIGGVFSGYSASDRVSLLCDLSPSNINTDESDNLPCAVALEKH
jgi:hypothetical protein